MSIDLEEVAESRRIVMVNGPNGLHGERAIKVNVDSENPLFALDYRNDLGLRQKILDVDTLSIVDGTGGGLSFATGKRGTLAKLRITATVADTYEVLVRVLYGGDWRSAHITVIAS